MISCTNWFRVTRMPLVMKYRSSWWNTFCVLVQCFRSSTSDIDISYLLTPVPLLESLQQNTIVATQSATAAKVMYNAISICRDRQASKENNIQRNIQTFNDGADRWKTAEWVTLSATSTVNVLDITSRKNDGWHYKSLILKAKSWISVGNSSEDVKTDQERRWRKQSRRPSVTFHILDVKPYNECWSIPRMIHCSYSGQEKIIS